MINRQFYIYKFDSKFLSENNYNIKIKFRQAKENNQIIPIADGQVLRSIRDICGRYVDKEKVEALFQKREEIKKDKSSKTNAMLIKDINKQINTAMFIPEYVSIVINSKAHYKRLFYNGLFINGEKYKRFSCSASQARTNTVIFVLEKIWDELYKRLNNGRHEKPLNPSKFNAYLGLSSSATMSVSSPRVCVIKDCIRKRNTLVNYVTEVYDELEDDIIEEKFVDIEYNYFDGMGLISPEQSEKWAVELGLEHIPSEWCIRNAWIKGMVCTFPFVEFCEKNNNGNYLIETIYKDKNGNQIFEDIRNVDVILTESQFKMCGCYDSFQEYEQNAIKNKLFWGISRYTPEEDKNNLFLNYQSIQTLKLSQEDIEKLCEPTVNWIKNVTKLDPMYSILFLMGKSVSPKGIDNLLRSGDNYWLKSLVINNNVLSDKFVSNKIYDLMITKIKNACMGKIVVDGNYQVLVSDPFAFMQHACGLDPVGLLGENKYYSKYWNDRNVSIVDSMRSPLTYRSEHNLLYLENNESVNYWYRYLKTGIIVNVHGDDVLRWADSDFDMDIVATTSNQIIINGVYKDELAVTYQKKTTDKILFTQEDLYKADLLAFGSEIGAITNRSTSMYAMLPLYEKNSPEYKELEKRLIRTRVAQGNAIDKAKGVKTKDFPKHWTRYQHINEDDSNDVVNKKKLFNSILIEKKPYFFRYLYKDSRTSYNKFLEEEFAYSKIYGFTDDEISSKKELTEKEKYYLDTKQYRNPLIESSCEMNLLCRYIESVNFETKKNKNKHDDSIFSLYLDKSYSLNEETYKKVKKHIKEYMLFLSNSRELNVYKNSSKFSEEEYEKEKTKYDLLKEDLSLVCSNPYELTNYLVEIFYKDNTSYNKDILWKCYGKYIYLNVLENSNKIINIPQISNDGKNTYLFDKYDIIEVFIE